MMMKRMPGILPLALFVLALLAGLPTAAAAQEDMGTGRVAGRVVDEAGAPVAGAEVTAASLQSATKLTATTDTHGDFAIVGFGTGPWRFSAAKPGYEGAPVDVNVRQLVRNPPVTLVLKKAAAAAAPALDETTRRDFDAANALAGEGRAAEALVLYETILEKHPGIYQVQLNAGLCAWEAEKTEAAKAHFQAALDLLQKDGGRLDKDAAASARALVGLGQAALREGDLAGAKGYFRRALDLTPNDELAAYNIAEILFAGQSVDEAISYYELALRIKAEWQRPLFKLGLAYLNKGDYDKALEFLNRFIAVADPANPLATQAQGMIESIKKLKK